MFCFRWFDRSTAEDKDADTKASIQRYYSFILNGVSIGVGFKMAFVLILFQSPIFVSWLCSHSSGTAVSFWFVGCRAIYLFPVDTPNN